MLFAPTCDMIGAGLDIEPDFEFFVRKSNALEECLRRNDFAAEYLEIYMAESENIPVYYEGMAESEYAAGNNKIKTLNAIELILAQPEAYEQLSEVNRATLVKRVIEREKNGNQGAFFYTPVKESYTSFFLSCITGDSYISGTTGECVWETNPWIKAVNEMELTEDERSVADKYLGGD
ncbi:MAG: hypothetical protein NC223_00295 [Butyrivibrio sp.]|nr:hypothetical protein [Butyrivibrio sp.]